MNQPRSAAELRELRHDLRTPFNAILNFAEMMLEDGAGAAERPLEALKGQARGLLGDIEATLAVGQEVTAAGLVALGGRIEESLRGLNEHLEAARAAGQGEQFHDDLGRLGNALGNLARVSAELLLSCPWPPPSSAVSPALAEQPTPAPPIRTLGAGRVLVVDDNATNRDLLSRRLEREGCTPVEADGGEAALALLAAGGVDVMLLDLRMPGMDGFEVLRRARADAVLREVPIIVVSALDDMASVVRCIEMGAEDYLPKPFDPVLLRARVGACLDKKRLRDKELEYLRGVEAVQQAAASVEAGQFDPAPLQPVSRRQDELGQLARVFLRMAGEVRAREERLKAQVQALRIEIDSKRKDDEVRAVTESEVFSRLAGRAEALRAKMKGEKG